LKLTNFRTALENILELKDRELKDSGEVENNILPTKAGPSVDIEELEQLLSENSRMVKENPQQAALLIRYLLNDEKK